MTAEPSSSLEIKFKEMQLDGTRDIKTRIKLDDYLPEASPFCKLCNDSAEVGEMAVMKEGECDRCGLSFGFYAEILGVDLASGLEETNLGMEFSGVVNLEDELTRDLYLVWDEVTCLDRSKRIKRSDSR